MALIGPIMIVEDDTDDQLLIHEIISEFGIENQLLSFHNGEEALDYLTSGSECPSLIICDINMPLMNGVELRRRIHGDEVLQRRCIPFIFLTTTAEPVTVSIAYKLNVQGFFEKKNSYEALKTQLYQIISYWDNCLQPSSFSTAGRK